MWNKKCRSLWVRRTGKLSWCKKLEENRQNLRGAYGESRLKKIDLMSGICVVKSHNMYEC